MIKKIQKIVVFGLIIVLVSSSLVSLVTAVNQPEISVMGRKLPSVKAVTDGPLYVTVTNNSLDHKTFWGDDFTVLVEAESNGQRIPVSGANVTCNGALFKSKQTFGNGKVTFHASIAGQFDVDATYGSLSGRGQILIKPGLGPLNLNINPNTVSEGENFWVEVKDHNGRLVIATVTFFQGDHTILGVGNFKAPYIKENPSTTPFVKYSFHAYLEPLYNDSEWIYLTVKNDIDLPPNIPSLDAPIYIAAPADGKGTGYFTVNTTDSEDSMVKYGFSRGNDNNIEWTAQSYPSEKSITLPLSFEAGKIYNVKVKAKDDPNGDGDFSDGRESGFSSSKKVIVGNCPPNKPSEPSNSGKGKPGVEVTFSTVGYDPNVDLSTGSEEDTGDVLEYNFNWGDGKYSGWFGPYSQGITASASHTYESTGNFYIQVQARDDRGLESEWSDKATIIISDSIDSSISITPSAPAGGSGVSSTPSASVSKTVTIPSSSSNPSGSSFLSSSSSSSPSISSSLSSSSSQPIGTPQSVPATITPTRTPTAKTTITTTSTAPISKSTSPPTIR